MNRGAKRHIFFRNFLNLIKLMQARITVQDEFAGNSAHYLDD
jgi:hypothetical protein